MADDEDRPVGAEHDIGGDAARFRHDDVLRARLGAAIACFERIGARGNVGETKAAVAARLNDPAEFDETQLGALQCARVACVGDGADDVGRMSDRGKGGGE